MNSTAHSRNADFASRTLDGGTVLQQAPLLERHDHSHPSVFLPEVMLKEARKQKKLDDAPIPPVCLLDPDGPFMNRPPGAPDPH